MMDLKEFYAQIGGSFDAVLSRLCSESFVRKFVLRYKTDPTFEQLKAAVAVKDWESAFRAAHTLKGVTLNLGLSSWADKTAKLVETLRSVQDTNDIHLAFTDFDSAYRDMDTVFSELLASLALGGVKQ